MRSHSRRHGLAGAVAAAVVAVLAGTPAPATATTAPPDAPAAPSKVSTGWGSTCAKLVGVGSTPPSYVSAPAPGLTVKVYPFRQSDGTTTQVSVARADLSKVKLLTLSQPRVGTVRTVLSTARSRDLPVAVNGDFFELGTETEALTYGPQARGGSVAYFSEQKSYVAVDAAGLPTTGTAALAGTVTFTDPHTKKVLRTMVVTRVNSPSWAGGLTLWTRAVHPDNYQFGGYPVLVRRGKVVGKASPLTDLATIPAWEKPTVLAPTRAGDIAWLKLPVSRTATVRISVKVVDATTGKPLKDALGAGMTAIHDGVPATRCSSVRPRTVIAWSADRRTAWFVTANGTPSTWSFWVGATYKQMGQLVHWLGADEGRFLDGGGSTTMIVDSGGDFRRVDGGILDYLREVPVSYAFTSR